VRTIGIVHDDTATRYVPGGRRLIENEPSVPVIAPFSPSSDWACTVAPASGEPSGASTVPVRVPPATSVMSSRATVAAPATCTSSASAQSTAPGYATPTRLAPQSDWAPTV
jgi:hypothetical protein